MHIVRRPGELSQLVTGWKEKGLSIGFVPTMGALHSGHTSLVAAARSGCDRVVVSIFVNPTQFNNPEDLSAYPRREDQDRLVLEEACCDALFLPSVEDMYPSGTEAGHYDLGNLESMMEGHHRPGHFQGVATVVDRLFRMVRPDKAYFGEKDFQQLAVIRHLNQTLHWRVEIVGCENVREEDGLAMSSRNLRLSPAERKLAPEIYRALKHARNRVGEIPPPELAKETLAAINRINGMKTEYVEIADEKTLEPLREWVPGTKPRIFAAVLLGNIRLIDNLPLF